MERYARGSPLREIVLAQAPLGWIVLGYLTFLVTGYSALRLAPGHDTRALPLYVYLSLLLLGIQWLISGTRSLWYNVYVYATSVFAIVYAADAYFFNGQFLLNNPATYDVINALIFAVFLYDAVLRQRVRAQAVRAGEDVADYTTLVMVGANAAGFAVLCFISWGLLQILPAIHPVPGVSQGLAINPSLPQTVLGMRTLGDLDLNLAVVSLIVGGLCVAAEAVRHGWTRGGESGARFAGVLRRIGAQASDEGTRSLGLVLNPLIWLIPAFAVAQFALAVTEQLVRDAAVHSSDPWWQLFNPFESRAVPETVLSELLFGALAVGAVIVAVAWAEHNAGTLMTTLRIIRRAGMAMGLSVGVLLLVLTLTNVLLLRLQLAGTQGRPFQLGPDTLLALAVAAALILASIIRGPLRHTGDSW